MSQFSVGITFSDSAPGNSVTAERLQAFLTEADALPPLITNKTAVTSLDGTDYFLIYDGSEDGLRKVSYSYLTSSPVGVTGARNLVVKNNSGSPTTTVDITADEIMMRDSSGVLIRAASPSGSCNITVTGENGRDTGSEAASTWYYLWAINNGGTTAFLLSTSASAPTMPNGYDYKARIGGVYNDGSSNFWTFQQNDDDYSTVRQVNTPTLTLTANTDPTSATNYQSYVLDGSSSRPFIPVTAYRVRGTIGRTDANSSRLVVSASTGGLGAQILDIPNSGTAVDSFTSAGSFDVPIATTQTIYLKDGNGATNVTRISVSGFKLKL